MQKRIFELRGAMRLTALVLLGLGVGYAQESGGGTSVNHGQSGLAYFLGEQDAIQADATRLQAEMDDLQKKYAAEPNAGLRDAIREREAFVAKIREARAEAGKFVSPALLVTLDWLAHDAQDGANALKADLNARLKVPNPERVALKVQIDKLQQEIDRKAKLAKALAEKVKSLADDRRHEALMSELDALTKPTGVGSVSQAVGAVIIRDKEEEQ